MDDSDLWTGVTSATPARQVVNAKKEDKKLEIKPASQIVLDSIAKEKKRVADINDMIVGVTTPDEDVKADLVARKRYIELLKTLEQKISTEARKEQRQEAQQKEVKE